MPIGDHIRDLRWDRHLKQGELAQRAGIAQNTLSQIELGKTTPSVPTLEKIARGLNLDLSELLLEEPVLAEKLEGGLSLGDLHNVAECQTNWLVVPEKTWIAAWHSSLTPEEAMRIVHELHREFSRLEPLMTKQEQDLPVSRRMFNGRYGQAWRRFFSGLEAAHEVGVVHGIIERDETLNNLAERLGEKPTESYKKLQLAVS